MATLTTQEKLDEAQAAYHQLVIGRAPSVVVEQNGERVEFTQANRAALQAYISDLIAQINGELRGPLGVMF